MKAMVMLPIVFALALVAGCGPSYPEFLAQGNHSEVKEALDAGADPNASDSYGVSALMRAAENGRYDLCRLLVNKGANINQEDTYGFTAVAIAARNNRSAIVELLIEKGARINYDDYPSDRPICTPLAAAVSYKGSIEVASYLLKKGANVNGVSSIPNTVNGPHEVADLCTIKPLYMAAAHGNGSLVDLLRQSGARSPSDKGVLIVGVRSDLKGFDYKEPITGYGLLSSKILSVDDVRCQEIVVELEPGIHKIEIWCAFYGVGTGGRYAPTGQGYRTIEIQAGSIQVLRPYFIGGWEWDVTIQKF